MRRSPPSSPLFPYTTLFRSCSSGMVVVVRQRLAKDVDVDGRGLAHDVQRHAAPCGKCLRARPAAVDRREATGREIERRSEEHTSELQSRRDLVCRLLLEKKN